MKSQTTIRSRSRKPLTYIAACALVAINLLSLYDYLTVVKNWDITDPASYPKQGATIVFFSTLILLSLFARPKLREGIARIRCSPLNNRLIIGCGIFFVALAVRIAFYHLNKNETIGCFSIGGVPFSDSQAWNDLAIDIAAGKGITGSWSARRPFYPIFLALFYTWFGYSLPLAKLINVIAGALAVVFVYLIGEKVFDRMVAVFVSLILILSSGFMYFDLILVTETVALLFFVLTVYLLLLGLERRRSRLFFGAGTLFAFSNLAQSLTLLAFPGFMIGSYYLLREKGQKNTNALKAAAAFGLGVFLILTPWLIRQKTVHGILTISDNLAECFYAATTPELKNWSGAVDQEAAEKELIGTKERFEYFMNRAIANIRSNPFFFIRNSTQSFYQYMKALDVRKGLFHDLLYNLTALFMFSLFLLNITRAKDRKEMVLLSCLLPLMCFVQRSIPSELNSLIVLSGIVLAVAAAEKTRSLILANGLIFSGVGSAIVGGVIKERTFILIGWAFLLYYLFAVSFVFQYLASRIISRDAALGPDHKRTPDMHTQEHSLAFEPPARIILKGIAALLVLFLFVSGVRLTYLNYFTHLVCEIKTPPLTVEQKREILAAPRLLIPAAFNAGEPRAEGIFFESLDYSAHQENHGKIFIERGTIGRYVYHLREGEEINHWSRLFYPRPYERSIFQLEDGAYFLFPGEIPQELRKRELVFVGRVNVDTRFVYEGRILVEGIALIPYDTEKDQPEMQRMLIAENKFHRMFLEYNKPAL